MSSLQPEELARRLAMLEGAAGADSPLKAAIPKRRALLLRFAGHTLALIPAAGAYVAYQHFKIEGQAAFAMASLVIAAGLALMPVRALLHSLLALEGKVLHLVHGIGGLAVMGLAASGVFNGGALVTHAALAPFAIMGAAQALMHSDHPRNAQQAQALRRFITSLPEVEQFTRTSHLSSPENVRRAVTVLTDLIGKAQQLGETELESDPGFQGAMRRATTRTGLSLGLDAADQMIDRLAKDPRAAHQIPALRRALMDARRAIK